jgi:hypothetical protein
MPAREIIGEENILPAQPLLLASLRDAWTVGQSRLNATLDSEEDINESS